MISRLTTNVLPLLSLLLISGFSYGQIETIELSGEETPSQPLCGLYALLGAAECLGQAVDLNELFDSEYVSSSKGSSISDLSRAARQIGLFASPSKRGSVSSLKSSACPQLLHLNRSRHQTTSRHWILYLGDENGRARILDPPRRIESRDYSDLLAEWDGVAISISNNRSTNRVSLHKSNLFALIIILCLFSLVTWVKQLVPMSPVSLRHVSFAATSLIAVSIFIGNLIHATSVHGLHRNPSSTSLLFRFHYAVNLPRITLGEIQKIVGQPNEHVIVDARPSSAFFNGHIPGAISIPVDSRPEQFSDALEELPMGKSVTVYCESKNCTWDEFVARHLHFAGIENVQLYEGGWREWQSARD